MFPRNVYLLKNDTCNIFLEIRYHKLHHKNTRKYLVWTLHARTRKWIFSFNLSMKFCGRRLNSCFIVSIDRWSGTSKGDFTYIHSHNHFSVPHFFSVIFSVVFNLSLFSLCCDLYRQKNINIVLHCYVYRRSTFKNLKCILCYCCLFSCYLFRFL